MIGQWPWTAEVKMDALLVLFLLLSLLLGGTCQGAADPQEEHSIQTAILRELADTVHNLQKDMQSMKDQLATLNDGYLNPFQSCWRIAEAYPSAKSGYYWVQDGGTGQTIRVYCNMDSHCCNSTRGWMRVANVNMTDPTQQCPPEFTLKTENGVRACGRKGGFNGCTSITFSSHGIEYGRVCGRIRAYQFGRPYAFQGEGGQRSIDNKYVNGISITHGSSPRKHIWTFAAAQTEYYSNSRACPCTRTDRTFTGTVPSFIGNDYFCDTAVNGSVNVPDYTLYTDDPLWDGQGCGPTSSCCTFNNPPWFCTQFPQPTADDIELRMCGFLATHDDTPFDQIELYIQNEDVNGIESLTSKVDSLCDKTKSLATTMDSLSNRTDSLTSKVDSLSTRSDSLTSKVDSLNSSLTSKVDSLSSKSDSLASKVDLLNNSLTSKVDSLSTRSDSLTSKVDSLNSSLTSKVDSLSSKSDSLASKVDLLNNSLTSKVESLRTRSDSLTSKVDSLSARSDSLTSKMVSLNSSLSSKVDSLSTRSDSLTSKVDSLSARSDSLLSKIDTLNNSLIAKVDSLSTRSDSLTSKVNLLSTWSDSLTSNFTMIAESLREEQDSLKTVTVAVSGRVESLHDKIDIQTRKLTNITHNIGLTADNTCTEVIRNETAELLQGQRSIQKYLSNQLNPYPSCWYITKNQPSTESGYYWVQDGTGQAVEVYCDMDSHCCNTRGWMRVANVDMTDPTQQCPPEFTLKTENGVRVCGRKGGLFGCTATTFSSHGIEYGRVCGRIRAYQFGGPDAFGGSHHSIDDHYVDGISITHGSSPRKHIWTFAAAFSEYYSDHYTCPCTRTDLTFTGTVPSFTGNDYFCDTAASASVTYTDLTLYTDDPLWDGQGCSPTSSCCSFNNPPWFCTQLPQPTTDDIELRMCGGYADIHEDTPFDQIELYVQ